MKNLMQKPISLGGMAVLAALGASAPAQEAPPEKRPNLLLFIADDWSCPHAGAYGDPTVRTPAFDYVADHGMLFTRAFCAAPTSTASRAAVLTGRYSHACGSAGNLWSLFPRDLRTYTRMLDSAGYEVGYTKKGWGPGRFEEGGWADNPAGHYEDDLKRFIVRAQEEERPFCFWYGSRYPHRPYQRGKGEENGIDPRKVVVPPHLADTEVSRGDLADYYYFVERLDYELEETLRILRETGEADNTLVVVTSDNGMPFPRAKATLYDTGTHMPFAVMWGDRIAAGSRCDRFVSLVDICPTFLEAAGVPLPDDLHGRSLLPLLLRGTDTPRAEVFSGRERHGLNSQPGNISYPIRSVREGDFLLVHNIRPWLAPDDVDGSPSKHELQRNPEDPYLRPFYDRSFAVRPEWELYDLRRDPQQFVNVADDRRYRSVLRRLRKRLERWQLETDDPRAGGQETEFFDTTPYFGKAGRKGDKPRKAVREDRDATNR